MSHTYTEIKENLTGMSHGGTLNKVRNIEALFERAGNTMLAKLDPIETMRVLPVSQVIHDDLNNYPLPTGYKKLVDIYPQDNRNSFDTALRKQAEEYSLFRGGENRVVGIEAINGSKFMRLNWKSTPSKTMNTMDSLTSNGSWIAVAGATNIILDYLYKISGNASIRFDLAATGDGISNIGMTALDLTTWDEQAEFIVPVYLPAATLFNSVTAVWGNDITTNYWTSVAQTLQYDGSAVQAGWNYFKFPWTTATETGTVVPTAIDSFKLTFNIDSALADVRVDNILVSLGRNFDIKFFSQYFTQNTSGTWLARTASDDDTVVFDGTAYNIYLHECALAIAHQVEGEDSGFDISYHNSQLNGNPGSPDPRERVGLYARYRSEYPAQTKKATARYGSSPSRGRW
jgi:hypothetical protein